ncbi:MAG: RidA family protein [Verrucomicrobiota bacterium]
MKSTHRTIPGCPPALGPYSLAVQTASPLLFVSGMTPWDPATGKIERGSITDQTRLVLENIRRVVEGSGAKLENTVSCRVYLSKMDKDTFGEMNAVYAEYFGGDHPPARATVGAALPGEFDVEIECVVAV